MTRFIGLTGGIGAGKSEALAALGRLGAKTLSTDAVTHELLGSEQLRDLLVERWGDEVAPGGVVDRDQVARIVFERPEELAFLESELHPGVGQRVLEWRSSLDPATEVAVVEVPLLFEAGMEGAFDAVIAVIADDAVREQRLAERDNAGLAGRSERQLGQPEKADRADYVVRNDGSLEDLERELAGVLERVGGSSEVGQ
ncbi:MAG: dephospho-CoA kinase [Solirubrobacterales bacterium]